ncbi:MAG: hypothetical protein D6768_12185 [Chloroflexi bacterium]|nr:MAG: hypothetical protein D6768_12185 [Chloroflexota bacterium]
MNDLTDQDKLMSALSYPIGIVAIIILLVEDMKNRPFQKYHAVQALAVNIVLVILSIVLGWTVVLACVPLLLWLVTFYWAYKAYQGEKFTIPGLTDFLKGQGWIE